MQMITMMKRIIKVEYGNTQVNSIVEFDANTISVSTIVNIIDTIYYDVEFVNIYANGNPVMFFNKNFNSEIKIDLLEELITNAVNKPNHDEQMAAYLKASYLHDTKVKEIKDEVPIYRAAEHGCKIDAVSEVPDVKANDSSPVEGVWCNEACNIRHNDETQTYRKVKEESIKNLHKLNDILNKNVSKQWKSKDTSTTVKSGPNCPTDSTGMSPKTYKSNGGSIK